MQTTPSFARKCLNAAVEFMYVMGLPFSRVPMSLALPRLFDLVAVAMSPSNTRLPVGKYTR